MLECRKRKSKMPEVAMKRAKIAYQSEDSRKHDNTDSLSGERDSLSSLPYL